MGCNASSFSKKPDWQVNEGCVISRRQLMERNAQVEVINSTNLRFEQTQPDMSHVKLDLNNLEEAARQLHDRIQFCLAFSADSNAILRKIDAWANKYVEKEKCVKIFKFIIKHGGRAILIGLACVIIAMPHTIPFIVASGTIVNTLADWLVNFCEKKQKDLIERKEKLTRLREEIVEARSNYKLEMIVKEFESFMGIMDTLGTHIGSLETDVQGVEENLAKARRSIVELQMRIMEFHPMIKKVVECVLDAAP